jgi:hypothetical protein
VSGKSVLALAALAIAALALAWLSLARPWSFTVDNRTYDGRFFRVDVKLSYKGEPHPISFVVGCSVRGVKYADGSSTRDIGLTPNFYGHRMQDGQAVVVRPPDVCDGETTQNGKVPVNFMPVIIVYDNADTLDFGKAYVSDDAYDGPLAELTYDSTVISASDRATWEEFRRSGPKNVVTRQKYWTGAQGPLTVELGVGAMRPRFADNCIEAKRYKIPEKSREIIIKSRHFREGQYWAPPKYEIEPDPALEEFHRRARNDSKENADYWLQTDDGAKSTDSGRRAFATADDGVPRRDGTGSLYFVSTVKWVPVTYYPISSDLRERNWPKDQKDWLAFASKADVLKVQNVEIAGGRNRGFIYCYGLPFSTDPEITKQLALNRLAPFVDGVQVRLPEGELKGNAFFGYTYIFDSDKYVIKTDPFFNGSMNGDV